MRTIALPFISLLLAFALIGCSQEENRSYDDGIYRGDFFDKGKMEVNVQFTLQSNVVRNISFRYLAYKDVDYLESDAEKSLIVRQQHQELAEYLKGKEVRQSLDALYGPDAIIKNEADGLTGATIRSGKVLSALRDGLNRGVYRR